MSDDVAATNFAEMRAHVLRLRRSNNADVLNLLSVVTALIDHLDPSGAAPALDPVNAKQMAMQQAADAAVLCNWKPPEAA
jgi:hypothetical protein